MNYNGDYASPSNIPLWIFDLAKLLPPVVNSTLQVFMVFLRKIYDFMRYFVHFKAVYYPAFIIIIIIIYER